MKFPCVSAAHKHFLHITRPKLLAFYSNTPVLEIAEPFRFANSFAMLIALLLCLRENSASRICLSSDVRSPWQPWKVSLRTSSSINCMIEAVYIYFIFIFDIELKTGALMAWWIQVFKHGFYSYLPAEKSDRIQHGAWGCQQQLKRWRNLPCHS